MKEVDICAVLRKHIVKKYGSQSKAAAAWELSPAFVSAVLHGNKQPNERMLSDAGYKRLEYSPQYAKVKQ